MATATVAHSLTIVCAWCERVLVQGGGEVSHGVCEACLSQFERQREARGRTRPS